ncbi:IS3 family transposase [Rhizobium anhuiense]
MQRRIFSREYKLEAVKLVRERGVAVAQAARDLDVHENVLRKWVREYGDDPSQSFPGKGQMKPEQLEIERLRREVAKLKAERDILKKAAAYFARDGARPRRRGLPKDAGDRAVIMPNVLDRQFVADRPNQKWVADFTYIWTAEGWPYVAAVIDVFSRRVVGWSMNANMTAQLVTDALIMAIWRRGKPDALLHHSDQGSQYTSEQFQRLMGDHGITCSMSRSGNVWDNAAMESFFSSLKTERTARKVYRTRNDARADVFDYIERFYNPRRRHSTLGYLSPNDFETKVGLA